MNDTPKPSATGASRRDESAWDLPDGRRGTSLPSRSRAHSRRRVPWRAVALGVGGLSAAVLGATSLTGGGDPRTEFAKYQARSTQSVTPGEAEALGSVQFGPVIPTTTGPDALATPTGPVGPLGPVIPPQPIGPSPSGTATRHPGSPAPTGVGTARPPAGAGARSAPRTTSAPARTTPAPRSSAPVNVVIPRTTTQTATRTTTQTTSSSVTPASCTYRYSFNSWSGGFTASIDLRNTSSRTLTDWDGGFWLDPAATITSVWGATLQQSANGWTTARPANYNTSIQPGGTVSLGFQASTTGQGPALGGPWLSGMGCSPA